MSSTLDFSDFRKTVAEKGVLLRGSHSSVKKRPYFPKRDIPLVPLDLNEIKREIREADNSDYPCIFNENGNKIEIIGENSEKSSSFSDVNNSLELSCSFKKAENTKESEFDVHIEIFKENVEQKTHISGKTADNDSFDLDFSAMSLYTPIKKEFVPVTPSKDILGSSKKHVALFNNFVTPNVKSVPHPKIHCSIPRNTTITSASKTLPNNPEKVQNNVNNIVCSIPRSIPNDKMFNRLHVNNVEYIILSLLGKGGSSQVYQCFCTEKRILVAIKCVSLENTASAQGYINEVQLLQKLQSCDRIIKVYDYEISEPDKKLLMVLEKGGEDFVTVLKNLARQKMNIPLYMLLFYWMEMLQAVKQIHSHEVIHADLKPSNFLWGDKGLKLIDFGIASSVQSDMTSVIKTLPEGSCNYMSPEAVSNDNSSPGKSKYKLHYKSDVWSLGCILYELVYKRPPVHHLKKVWTKLAFIMDPNHQIEYPEANWVPPKVIETIKKCLQYNVKSRPSVTELLEEYETSLRNI